MGTSTVRGTPMEITQVKAYPIFFLAQAGKQIRLCIRLDVLRRYLIFRLAQFIAPMTLVTLLSAAVFAQDQEQDRDHEHPRSHEFYFTRGIYTGINDGDDWGPRWAIDYPEADQHFLTALRRLTGVDAYADENALPIGSESIREFPFIYIVEAGALNLSTANRQALRDYLLSGGFLVVDDFWGTWAWNSLVAQMQQVFPDRQFRDIALDHPVFHTYYDIDALLQVPNAALASSQHTHEFDGYVPQARGIFDDDGRLMVLVNWNTDLGDAWEWADDPDYPLHFSNYAYRLGINIVIYAMSY
jgi:hypothetical protein